MRQISIFKGKRMTKSLETLINGEGKDLNLPNNYNLV